MTSNIHATLDKLIVPIEGLVPYERNPRRGDVDRIAESLTRNGQYRPIVVRAKTFEVLAGNHTLAAAKQLGWTEIAVTFVDVDDDQAARIVLADNRTAEVGVFDAPALADLLSSLPDLEGTGYTDVELSDLVSGDRDPSTLDDLADEYGEPADSDTWQRVSVKVPPVVWEAWKQAVDEAGDDELVAFARLLDVDLADLEE